MIRILLFSSGEIFITGGSAPLLAQNANILRRGVASSAPALQRLRLSRAFPKGKPRRGLYAAHLQDSACFASKGADPLMGAWIYCMLL